MSNYRSHFKVAEFACKCCGKGGIQTSTREKIEAARNIAGVPFIITSGFRCSTAQYLLIRQGRSKENSAHPRGYAVDIAINDSGKRFIIIDALLKVGFKRIGVGKDFIHADNDPDLPANVMWDYYD